MNVLHNYIHDSENALTNFDLAKWYEDQEHHSPASGLFLRAAELSENNIDIRYEALLRAYFCYNRAKRRNFTCESLLKTAIGLAPDRPEAYYFLTQLYESNNDWLNVYIFATLGIENCSKPTTFMTNMYFRGLYQLYFQKAAGAWWIGKAYDARRIYRYILDNFIDDLDPDNRQILQNNLSMLGGGPEYLSFKKYYKNEHFNRFKFPFSGYENIRENFSQTYQDMFLLALLDGKKNGTYLEIGAAKPFYGNNTALLEKDFGWTGVGLEYKQELADDYSRHRKNPVLKEDALTISYNKLLAKYFPDTEIIDYLQLDIEPSKSTFEAMLAIPFDKYQFRFITYEHDYYVDITKSYREKSRRYLSGLGYKLVVNDVCGARNCNFEDWWVKPELIDQDILAQMTTVDLDIVHNIEDVVLNPA